MQPVIDYFENAKKQYVTSSKEDRKMRYASFYDLAKIYLYFDEPEKAMTEADALAMNDFDERDGRALRQEALVLQNKLRKNNANSPPLCSRREWLCFAFGATRCFSKPINSKNSYSTFRNNGDE